MVKIRPLDARDFPPPASKRHAWCLNGECQYAKDVGVWPTHECLGTCYYVKNPPEEDEPALVETHET
jgi:hypothetical protein